MKLSTLTLALCLGAIGLPAAAQSSQPLVDDETTSTMTIRVGDLDPSRAEGAAVLLNRVMWSAAIACGPRPNFGISAKLAFRDCVRANTRTALKAVNEPRVTALYAARSGGAAIAGR